jgi:hypothetical protein
MGRNSAASELREEFERLESAEERASSEEDYTLEELQDDLDVPAFVGVLSASVYNQRDEEVVIHEDGFDQGFRFQGQEAGYADRPLKLETGVLLGSAAGLAGSAYQLWKSGDPFYLGTGLLSAGTGSAALSRISRTLSARSDREKLEEEIDESIEEFQDYEIRVLDEKEFETYLEENTGLSAYEDEDLEDMSGEQLKRELERDVYG